MKRAVSVALFLWLAPAALAQEAPLSVKGDGVRTAVLSFPFTVHAPAGSGLYFWTYPPGVTANDQNDKLQVTAAPQGEHVISVKIINPKLDSGGKFIGFDTKIGRVTVLVGTPPDPKPPDPKPPDPNPPAPAKALRVLLLYETADTNRYTAGQRGVLFGQQMRTFLDANCAMEVDGWKAYRIWDKDVTSAADPRNWKALVDRPHPQMPWIVIADGSVVLFEGPMPPDTNATIALISKYAGGK